MEQGHSRNTTAERDSADRYCRQVLFAPFGPEGQRRLLASRVLLVGCGALGSTLANLIVRAGVGFLRIVDRDVVELDNLHRLVLFDEDDVREGLPKAEAARRKLARINSGVTVEAVVDDVSHTNIVELAAGADLILDATDNFETRFLINDLAVKTGRPWVYGACVGSTGLSMPIIPGETPCLRCVFEDPPPMEMSPTCDTAGILGPVVGMVANHQAMEAIKILSGHKEAVDRRLLSFDAWTGRSSRLDVRKAFEQGDCPCCKQGRFEYLEGAFASRTVRLCGRNAVQVYPSRAGAVDLPALAARLRPLARSEPKLNPLLLKVSVDDYEITVFADGRALIKGTNKPEEARAVYARYIGA
ncbi:MAG TPA: ThiF family adenylyltransferase [Phycisphaerae bacterium]|nr:ThiF family adenylyltransferase [Phycisphaerae bacterium]HRR85550.1 ThiF family adenylyltransferase [Phycisphaerae bacterium]